MTGSRISAGELRSFAVRAFCAAGLPTSAAEITSDSLVDADLRGLDDHGAVARLPTYTGRIRAGGVLADAEVTVVADLGALVTLDAHAAIGQLAAHVGMTHAIDRARTYGVGVATVADSNHLGVLGYWSALAARDGLVGFSLSGAGARMPAWGGAEALLSSSPWSWAFPVAGRDPLVVDLSNTSVVWMVFAEAARRGESLPPGLALDAEGRATTDPDAAMRGLTLPFGGAKGGALSLAMEVLCTAFAGGATSVDVPALTDLDRPQRLGQLFMALRPDAAAADAAFGTRVADLIAAIEGSRPAAGFDGVRVPGQRRDIAAAERTTQGIPVASARLEALDDLASTLSVDPVVRH